MELKLNGDQFDVQYQFPFNLLMDQSGLQEVASFAEGFLSGGSFVAAIVSWLFVEVVAPEKAPFMMASIANFLISVLGLSDEGLSAQGGQARSIDNTKIEESRRGPSV